MADNAELCDHRQSNESETPEQPPQTSRLELTGEIVSLPGAVEALNAVIKKIIINERDMKTLLEQTKSVLDVWRVCINHFENILASIVKCKRQTAQVKRHAM